MTDERDEGIDRKGVGDGVEGGASRGRRALALAAVLVCACAAASLLYLGYARRLGGRLAEQAGRLKDAVAGVPARTPDPYAEAVTKVEEDRGEDTGRKADVEVPAELRQYAEARRFLGVQEASAKLAGLKAPHDFAELVAFIRDGGLVEAQRLGRGYVLYGVGLAATGELTHYDDARGRTVPLFADDAGLKAHTDGLNAERERLKAELKDLDERLKALGRKERQARAELNAEAKAKRKELAGVEDKLKSLALHYATPKGRDALFKEHATQLSLARDFGGRSYELGEQTSAREFQARMLAFVRPAALAVMEELGSAYQEKFGRPLPVTSLVRTEEYQRTLRVSGNANAGDFRVEPHTTGLAFDVYYRFMTAAEQQFVMDEVARLERDGRVEALRELRDHYHIFVFPEGRRPDDKSIANVLKGRRVDAADDPKAKPKRAADDPKTRGRARAPEPKKRPAPARRRAKGKRR